MHTICLQSERDRKSGVTLYANGQKMLHGSRASEAGGGGGGRGGVGGGLSGQIIT